jgi:hypothetical protein
MGKLSLAFFIATVVSGMVNKGQLGGPRTLWFCWMMETEELKSPPALELLQEEELELLKVLTEEEPLLVEESLSS